MQSSDRILKSLRSRTWIAVSGLAVLNCVVGLIVFLTASFFIADALFALVLTFLVTAFVTMMFGWWLSNDVLRPIETVGLLAKSLERSPSASLPKSTGTTETDEILFSLHRTSRQLNNLVNLMDDVAAGKTDAASLPLQTTDRLSTSFQKLVARVTDSIDAKRELDELRSAVDRLKQDISGVRHDAINTVARDDDPATRQIADSVNYLAEKLRQVVRQIKVSSIDARALVERSRMTLGSVAEMAESKGRKLTLAAEVISDTNERFSRIANLVENTASGDREAESQQGGFRKLWQQQTERIARLSSQLADVLKRLDVVRDKADSVDRSARLAGEIARRANLLALNTSLPGNGLDAVSLPVGFISEEITLVSQRTEAVRKEVVDVNDALVREITVIQSLVKSINAEAYALAEHDSTEESVGRLESYLDRLRQLPAIILPIATAPSVESNQFLDDLRTTSPSEKENKGLFEACDHDLSALCHILEDLSGAVFDLGAPEHLPPPKPPQVVAPETQPENQPSSRPRTSHNPGSFDH